jgi:Arc/MetJ-type ribon-helix-helix transcriptional regulator
MVQNKFSFREKQAQFVGRYREFGFKDKSALVRAALDLLEKELEQEKLKASAVLYGEVFNEDRELRDLTEEALGDWPE